MDELVSRIERERERGEIIINLILPLNLKTSRATSSYTCNVANAEAIPNFHWLDLFCVSYEFYDNWKLVRCT